MSQHQATPLHRNDIEFNEFISRFEAQSNPQLLEEHNKLAATGMFAVGRQMRFALALHTVLKSRFLQELAGDNPLFKLNLKTTFHLLDGELKAYPKLT